MHRFLISRPNLRIDVSFSPLTPSFVHRFLISGPDLRIDAASSLLQLRTARLQHHRCYNDEWLACYGCGDNEVRVRSYFSLPQRRIVSLQNAYREGYRSIAYVNLPVFHLRQRQKRSEPFQRARAASYRSKKRKFTLLSTSDLKVPKNIAPMP